MRSRNFKRREQRSSRNFKQRKRLSDWRLNRKNRSSLPLRQFKKLSRQLPERLQPKLTLLD